MYSCIWCKKIPDLKNENPYVAIIKSGSKLHLISFLQNGDLFNDKFEEQYIGIDEALKIVEDYSNVDIDMNELATINDWLEGYSYTYIAERRKARAKYMFIKKGEKLWQTLLENCSKR